MALLAMVWVLEGGADFAPGFSRPGSRASMALGLAFTATGVLWVVLPGTPITPIWPMLLAAGGALLTSVHVPPHQGIGLHALGIAAMLGLGAWLIAGLVWHQVAAFPAALALGLLVMATTALFRASGRGIRAMGRAREPDQVPPLRTGTAGLEGRLLAHLPRLHSDAEAPEGEAFPVRVRVPMRQIIEAALVQDRVPASDGVREYIVQVEPRDVDVEGDPGALARVFATLFRHLNSATGSRTQGGLSVLVRGNHQVVTVEMGPPDDMPAGAIPFLPQSMSRVEPVQSLAPDRPAEDLALAAARWMIQQHDGQLSSQWDEQGWRIRVVLPRRARRSSIEVV
jgi:hypothetical protein